MITVLRRYWAEYSIDNIKCVQYLIIHIKILWCENTPIKIYVLEYLMRWNMTHAFSKTQRRHPWCSLPLNQCHQYQKTYYFESTSLWHHYARYAFVIIWLFALFTLLLLTIYKCIFWIIYIMKNNLAFHSCRHTNRLANHTSTHPCIVRCFVPMGLLPDT